MNVLIFSAGRRVELVECFRKAKQKLNISSNVIAADCSNTAPALYFADKKFILPKIYDENNYINSIINLCNKEKIALIVPTIDTELLLLSEQKKYIESRTDAKVLISNIEVIKICRDKILTQKYMEKNSFPVPRMYELSEVSEDSITLPLFIKPKSGSSSVNTFKVNSYTELITYSKIIDDPIIQEYIQGEEYTVDVFLNFESEVLSIVPRLRMATRSGEISKGRIVRDNEIISSVLDLMKKLRPIGHITVQLMKTLHGIKYIEINPRFGGGAPMSIQAGADSCEKLYRLLLGEKLIYSDDYNDDLVFLRFDSSICIKSEDI